MIDWSKLQIPELKVDWDARTKSELMSASEINAAMSYPYVTYDINPEAKRILNEYIDQRVEELKKRETKPTNTETKKENNMSNNTDKVHIEIVYMDPVKWTPELFQKRDAVFGKKELIDKAKERFFSYIIRPSVSLSKYIRDIHAEAFREEPVKPREIYIPEIKNAYFNDPVTVVIWEDGTKTMVRCQDGDEYSAETGLALCIAKKALGNMPNFNNVFKKWIPETTGPKHHYTMQVEGVDFAKAMKEGDFLGRFRNAVQRAFGTEEV